MENSAAVFCLGRGSGFALRKRDWKQLLIERTRRILVPLIFGSFIIVTIHVFIFQKYYEQEMAYSPGLGHLWFLAYICIFVLQIIGFAFLDRSYNNKFFNFLREFLEQPYFLYLLIIPFILEAVLVNPDYFDLYIGNSHGLFIGMLAFFSGFLFVAIGEAFWNAVVKIKTVSLIIAFTLYLFRITYFEFRPPHFLTSIESMNWIFALLGFGYKYLNKPGKILSYLSQAAYPVYIIHMIFLYFVSYLIIPPDLALELKFVLILLFTFTGYFVIYELIIKRIGFIRPLFGLTGK